MLRRPCLGVLYCLQHHSASQTEEQTCCPYSLQDCKQSDQQDAFCEAQEVYVRGSAEQHWGSSSEGDKSEYNVLLWCKEKHLQLTKYKTK